MTSDDLYWQKIISIWYFQLNMYRNGQKQNAYGILNSIKLILTSQYLTSRCTRKFFQSKLIQKIPGIMNLGEKWVVLEGNFWYILYILIGKETIIFMKTKSKLKWFDKNQEHSRMSWRRVNYLKWAFCCWTHLNKQSNSKKNFTIWPRLNIWSKWFSRHALKK